MATFCADGWLELTILVDGTNTTVVFEKCAMFDFQLRSLHIFKDVAYDANNSVSISVYQMPVITVQGQEWVVSSRCYKVGDNISVHSQETILTP